MEEKVYLDEGGVKVTASRFVLGGNRTFAIAAINSVEYQQRPPGVALLLVLVGIALFVGLMALIGKSYIIGAVAIGLVALGILTRLRDKPTFVVALTTSAGQVPALESKDGHRIHAIVEALNQAIIDRH